MMFGTSQLLGNYSVARPFFLLQPRHKLRSLKSGDACITLFKVSAPYAFNTRGDFADSSDQDKRIVLLFLLEVAKS